MDDETKKTITDTAKKAEAFAEETAERPWIRAFSRVGFIAKGVLFLVIGVSAILLAAGLQGGRIADPVGAMSAIAQYPFGRVLLLLLVVGAVGHGVWNILRGIADIDNTGKGFKGIIGRTASVGIGLFYLILASFDERDGQGRPLQLAPKVRVAIIFTGIPRIMFPLWIGGNRLIPKCSRIDANARFIFNDHDGRGGMFDKHRQNAILQPGLGKRVLNALREILDVRISVHGNLHVVGFHGHDDSQIVTVCKKR